MVFFFGGAFSDFQEWRDRLHCFGLDFRDLSELERFCAFLKRSFARLDIIINNACQVFTKKTHFPCFLDAKVQILTPAELPARPSAGQRSTTSTSSSRFATQKSYVLEMDSRQ